MSNTQIYKNANYICAKIQFKAGKLLTYYQKKSIKKANYKDYIEIHFEFQFFIIKSQNHNFKLPQKANPKLTFEM